MNTFHSQYQQCRQAGLVGFNEGPEEVMDPAFPTLKYRDYVAKHGKPPTFKRSTCKRFTGLCSSGNEECRKLRGLEPHPTP